MHFCDESLPRGLHVGDSELVSCRPPKSIPVRVCSRVLLVLEPWIILRCLADLVKYVHICLVPSQNSIAITWTIAL